MNDPTVLTIIVNDRTPDQTLKSAEYALREMHNVRDEIVIVDCAQTSGDFEALTRSLKGAVWNQTGRVRLIQSSHRKGHTAGLNLGLKAGLSNGDKPDFYFLISSGALAQNGAISQLRDFLIAYPRAGIVGSNLSGPDGQPHQAGYRYPSISGEFQRAAQARLRSNLLTQSDTALPATQKDRQVDWVPGTSMMVRRQMLEQIGHFDESFIQHYQDIDLCRRASQKGWHSFLIKKSKVALDGPTTVISNTNQRVAQDWFDARLLYFLKTHGFVYTTMATFARIYGSLIRRLRCLFSGTPHDEPPMFLRDLIVHSLRSLAWRKQKPNKFGRDFISAQAILEDK